MTTSSTPDPLPELTAHADFLRALARRLVRDEAAADDVVQDVWLRSLRRPRGASGDPRSWLARVVRSVALDRQRSESARARREQSAARREAREDEGELTDRLAVVDDLGRALAALPEDYRRALHLRYYEDRSPEEIAARLGRPVATVKTRLRRGLQMLREDLRERTRGRGELHALLLPLCLGTDAARAGTTIATGVLLMKKTIAAALVLIAAAGAIWYANLEPRPLETNGALAARDADELPASLPDAGALAAVASEDTSDQPASREVVAAPGATAVSGRIVYASTGQGVPYFAFAVRDADAQESLTTDRAGRFVSRRKFARDLVFELPHEPPVDEGDEVPAEFDALAPGAVIDAVGASSPIVLESTPERIRWAEEPGFTSRTTVEERAVSRIDGETELELAVHVGPTFFLDVAWPNGTTSRDFRASYASGPDHFDTYWRRVAEVHTTPEAWVRFPWSPDTSTEEPEWSVALESASGTWVGKASAPFVLGVCESALRIRFEPCATVAGLVTDQRGAPVVDVLVRLQAQGGTRHDVARTDADGLYEFRRVLEGAHVLHVQDTHYFPWEAALHVRSRARVTADIRLDARPPGGNLRGRITSSTGSFQGRVVLFLEGIEDQDVWRRADPQWVEEDGRMVADYAFDDLGSGSYRVTCCTTDAVVVEDRDRVLSPPNESADFLVDDAGGARTLGLRALDAGTGDPVPDFRVYFHPLGNVEALESGSADEPWTREVYRGVRFTWRLHAPGYRAVTGDESTFAAPGVVDVELERGFSAVVNLLSIESMRSVAGVEVFADGRSVGWTNQDGFLYLDLPERPRLVTVDPTAWVVHDDDTYRSDFDLEHGFADWEEREVFLSAYLRPVR